jgi:hypothetical protein
MYFMVLLKPFFQEQAVAGKEEADRASGGVQNLCTLYNNQ